MTVKQWRTFQEFINIVVFNNVDEYFTHFLQACEITGNGDMIDLLLSTNEIDPSDNDNEAIRLASEHGHIAVVDRLLQDDRVDPSADNNYAIRMASENGHIAVVDSLLQDGTGRVDPNDYDCQAIRLASQNGHIVILEKLFQKFSNKKLFINFSLISASYHGLIYVIDILLQNLYYDNDELFRLPILYAKVNHHFNVVKLLQDSIKS